MRYIVLCIFLFLGAIVQAQDLPELENLEIISIDNVQELVLLGNYSFAEVERLQYAYPQQLQFNADSTRIYFATHGDIWYLDLHTSEYIQAPIVSCDCDPFIIQTHPTEPDLLIFNQNVYDTSNFSIITHLESYFLQYSPDGRYLRSATKVYDAHTGKLVEEQELELPEHVGYWDFDIDDSGDVIALLGFVEGNSSLNSYTVTDVLINQDLTGLVAPFDNPYWPKLIRVSSDGKWIAYLASHLAVGERFTGIVIYSTSDLENPIFTPLYTTDFEFDNSITMLVAQGNAYELESDDIYEISATGNTVEFSYDGKLLITLGDSSIQIWGVPISSDTE